VTIKGAAVMIPGLQLIFEQCFERSIPADDDGSAALLDSVKIYHLILPEEEPEYRNALLSAYREFCRDRQEKNRGAK
jgi:hypothetical protein